MTEKEGTILTSIDRKNCFMRSRLSSKAAFAGLEPSGLALSATRLLALGPQRHSEDVLGTNILQADGRLLYPFCAIETDRGVHPGNFRE